MSKRNKKTKEAACYAATGAAAGASLSACLGGMGLALGGTAVGIGMGAVIAAGAVLGLAAHTIKTALDEE